MFMAYLFLAYIVGSIPFCLIIMKYFSGQDIRNIGSKNIGFTNALRTGKKKLAVIGFVCDVLKGSFGVLICFKYFGNPVYGAYAAVLGHMFPIWLGFRGGKGVATGLGAMAILNPMIAFLGLSIWGITFKFTKISSLSAILAFSLMPVMAFFLGYDFYEFYALLSLVIIVKHQQNIKNLIQGTELGISQKK